MKRSFWPQYSSAHGLRFQGILRKPAYLPSTLQPSSHLTQILLFPHDLGLYIHGCTQCSPFGNKARPSKQSQRHDASWLFWSCWDNSANWDPQREVTANPRVTQSSVIQESSVTQEDASQPPSYPSVLFECVCVGRGKGERFIGLYSCSWKKK